MMHPPALCDGSTGSLYMSLSMRDEDDDVDMITPPDSPPASEGIKRPHRTSRHQELNDCYAPSRTSGIRRPHRPSRSQALYEPDWAPASEGIKRPHRSSRSQALNDPDSPPASEGIKRPHRPSRYEELNDSYSPPGTAGNKRPRRPSRSQALNDPNSPPASEGIKRPHRISPYHAPDDQLTPPKSPKPFHPNNRILPSCPAVRFSIPPPSPPARAYTVTSIGGYSPPVELSRPDERLKIRDYAFPASYAFTCQAPEPIKTPTPLPEGVVGVPSNPPPGWVPLTRSAAELRMEAHEQWLEEEARFRKEVERRELDKMERDRRKEKEAKAKVKEADELFAPKPKKLNRGVTAVEAMEMMAVKRKNQQIRQMVERQAADTLAEDAKRYRTTSSADQYQKGGIPGFIRLPPPPRAARL